MAYDVAAIKEQTDLLALASKTTSLKKVANTTKRGPEYAGECPRCGDGSGYDPFRVQPDAPGGGAFFCRHCHDKWGDVIEFVMWYDGVDFGRACAILGGQNMPQTGQESAKWGRYAAIPGLQRPQEAPRAAPASDKAATRPPVARTEAPSALWQEKARTFAADCQAQLWETPQALAYLQGRGLSDATIRAAGLGWHDKDQYRDPAVDCRHHRLNDGHPLRIRQHGELASRPHNKDADHASIKHVVDLGLEPGLIHRSVRIHRRCHRNDNPLKIAYIGHAAFSPFYLFLPVSRGLAIHNRIISRQSDSLVYSAPVYYGKSQDLGGCHKLVHRNVLLRRMGTVNGPWPQL